MDDDYRPHPDDDMVTAIEKLIAGLESGQIKCATLRVLHKDGTVQDLQIGYETEEEKAAAMAQLLKVLGELH